MKYSPMNSCLITLQMPREFQSKNNNNVIIHIHFVQLFQEVSIKTKEMVPQINTINNVASQFW